MLDPVVWIGGWASNLACWRTSLEGLYPSREHSFLDAHAILEEPGLLQIAANSLPPNGTMIAWSLGSLILHRSLASGELNTSCRLVSVCPIFDFCREGGPWPPAALFRMTRKLHGNRESTLAEFYALVQGDSSVSQAQTEAWKIQSRAYSLDSLLAGLAALNDIKVMRTSLPAHDRHTFFASAQDPLAPPNREDFPGPRWIGFPKGHLPFLDYPDLLRPLLSGKAKMASI